MKRKKLLVIGLVWPEPKSSAAGTRILQLAEMFQEQNFDIVFASAAQESEFSFNLTLMGIVSQKIELNDASFDLFVKELNPDLVIFDRYITEEQFGWRVTENCPDAIRILDSEDLHCLRLARQSAVKKGEVFQIEDLLVSEIAKREIASIYRCDLTLIISEFEMSVLKNVVKIDSDLLFYLPLFYEVPNNESLPSYSERNDFVFIGNFLHDPNWDAVQQLKTSIWPKIYKQLPDAKLIVYGAYPSQKVLELHNPKENFYIHGRANNAFQVLKTAKVLLAPLRFGAGLKGKLLECMQTGTPSVTTIIGAEGITTDTIWNGFVTNDLEDFALKAIQLFQDNFIWKSSQEKGFVILKEKFDKKLFENIFFIEIVKLQQNLKQHRLHNFIGTLLHHHSFQSTKYMSRWIEEKNK